MAVVPLLREAAPGLLTGESLLNGGDEIKKLESSIFNHISLGQWEAAKACVDQLAVSSDPATRVNARDLLKLLIVDAANYWYSIIVKYVVYLEQFFPYFRSESAAIPSPHHLSWLAFNTYKELFSNEKVNYYFIDDIVHKL